MTKYQFRLARVQRVRAVEEEIARARFGEAEVAARVAEERAEERRRDIDVALDDLRGLQGAPRLSPSSVMTAVTLVDEARLAWREADRVAREARARAEEVRREWTARRRDLEGLERLDERSRESFHRERERTDALALDEVASQRAARARRVEERRADDAAALDRPVGAP